MEKEFKCPECGAQIELTQEQALPERCPVCGRLLRESDDSFEQIMDDDVALIPEDDEEEEEQITTHEPTADLLAGEDGFRLDAAEDHPGESPAPDLGETGGEHEADNVEEPPGVDFAPEIEVRRRTLVSAITAFAFSAGAFWCFWTGLMVMIRPIAQGKPGGIAVEALVVSVLGCFVGAVALYLHRGYSLLWLANRVFALLGLALGLLLILMPASGAAGAWMTRAKLHDPMAGLFCGLCGIAVTFLFARVWHSYGWARRCAGISVLAFLVIMSFPASGVESPLGGLRSSAAGLGEALPAVLAMAAAAVLMAAAAAVIIPVLENPEKPPEEKAARKTISMIIAGVGLTAAVAGGYLCWNHLADREWAHALLKFGTIITCAFLTLLTFIALLHAWSSKVNLSADANRAVRSSWLVMIVVCLVTSGCLLPGLIDSNLPAAVAMVVAAALTISACWLGMSGVSWPVYWMAPVVGLLLLKLVSIPAGFHRIAGYGLNSRPFLEQPRLRKNAVPVRPSKAVGIGTHRGNTEYQRGR